jgi:hypothetical protein
MDASIYRVRQEVYDHLASVLSVPIPGPTPAATATSIPMIIMTFIATHFGNYLVYEDNTYADPVHGPTGGPKIKCRYFVRPSNFEVFKIPIGILQFYAKNHSGETKILKEYKIFGISADRFLIYSEENHDRIWSNMQSQLDEFFWTVIDELKPVVITYYSTIKQ